MKAERITIGDSFFFMDFYGQQLLVFRFRDEGSLAIIFMQPVHKINLLK